jgi:hypothetical protein
MNGQKEEEKKNMTTEFVAYQESKTLPKNPNDLAYAFLLIWILTI